MRYTWALLALAACHQNGLQSSAGIRLDPNSLALPPAAVGAQTSDRLTVINLGPRPISVDLSVDAPFSAEPPHLELAGAGSQQVTVRFTPARPGAASGQLRATTQSGVALAALTGSADCLQTDPCLPTHFDGMRCVPSLAPDGTACAGACLVNARCVAGACVGDPSSCDDGEACTLDSCNPSTGCVHTACEKVDTPCRVGSCGPGGCQLDPVPDGTACGIADCVDAPICLQGECTLAPVSEGSACDSPCGAGQCHDQRCQPASALTPLWSVEVPAGFEIVSSISLDASGDLYWLEYRFGPESSKRLASASPDGALRFRVGSPTAILTWTPPVVDDVNGLVLIDDANDTLRAVSQTDGTQAWASPLRAMIADPTVTPDDQLLVLGLLGGAGYAVADVGVYPPSGGSPTGEWLLGVDTSNGAPLWKRLVSPVIFGGAMDKAGNYYVRTPVAGRESIVSVDPQGNTRWAVDDPDAMGIQYVNAAAQGRVYLTHGEVLDAATGALLSLPPLDPVVDAQRFGDLKYFQGAWNVGPSKAWLAAGSYGDLRQIDSATGAIDWRGPSFYEQTALVLTTLDTGLIGNIETAAFQVSLAEVSPRGHEAWQCAVPTTLTSQPRGIALHAGRVYYGWTPYQYEQSYPGVMAFAVPGRELAPGWPVTEGGGPGLGRQER